LLFVLVVLGFSAYGWESPFTYKESDTLIENEYIVIFKNALNEQHRHQHMKIVSLLALTFDLEVMREWQIDDFSGYSIRTAPGFDLTQITNRSEVAYHEQNQRMFISDYHLSQPSPQAACVRQQDVPSWGLTRTTEHVNSLDGNYIFPDNSGAGVNAYIIDTGIFIEHPKFAGRAIWGIDTADKPPIKADNNGHGTHVAGTVVSDTYGLARAATAIAVKVLGANGSGTNDGVIAGINWAANDHKSRGTGRSVANMSLGGGLSAALNSAVAAAVKAGMVFAVAAGNDGRGLIPSPDACKHSPASEPSAICVGATDSTDWRADYSNYGKCVKLFAPGSAITSLWKKTAGQKEPINTISGTSMATPHVAGVLCKLWSLNPSFTGPQVSKLLLDTVTTGKLHDVVDKGSPDKLVFQACA